MISFILLDQDLGGAVTEVAKQLVGSLTPPLAAMVLIVLLAIGVAAVSKRAEMVPLSMIVTVAALLLIGVPVILGNTVVATVIAIVAVVAVVALYIILWRRPPLTPGRSSLDNETVVSVTFAMEKATEEVADVLWVDRARLRANMFSVCRRGLLRRQVLRMVPRLTVRMSDPIEQTLKMRVGDGVWGQAVKLRKPVVAVFRPAARRDDWSLLGLPAEESAKVNKNLCWVIIFPIPPSKPRFTFGVDGLEHPGVATLRDEALQEQALKALLGWTGLIEGLLRRVTCCDDGS